MKEMKTMKKLVAILLAAVMVMALAGTALAAEGDATSDATITVNGLAVGDVVTPYQIIEWKDSEGWAFKAPFNTLTADDLAEILGTPAKPAVGTVGEADYQAAQPAVDGKITQTMANKIAALAKNGTPDAAQTGSTWTKNVGTAPGLYMITVAAKESGVVYNPIFMGADFITSNSTNTIDVSATYSDTSVAKKTTITTDKTVDNNEDSDEIKAAKASLVGDIVSFKITTTIPVFLDSYQNPSFKIEDQVSTGMELVVDATHPITVKYGESNATNNGTDTGDTNVTITKESTTKYSVDFQKDYLDTNSTAVSVEVTYYARITNSAAFNVNRENNTVTVTYSNGPENQKGVEKDVTNHYTFSIGASIIGKSGKKGYEAVKVGVDNDGNELTELSEVTLDNGNDTDTAHSLSGAKFGLYTSQEAAAAGKDVGEASNGLVVNTNYPNGATFTTGADGIITFNGLDAGTYYLKELDAPDGYVKDATVKTVTIAATYEEKNITEEVSEMSVTYKTSVLKEYTVTIDGHTTKYEFNNEGETLTDPVIKDITTDEARIKNTKGMELPSTGGIGTTIFYISGMVLVLGAAAILVARRKAEQE
jgi:LPXTG-motif cell wall-anchored protein